MAFPLSATVTADGDVGVPRERWNQMVVSLTVLVRFSYIDLSLSLSLDQEIYSCMAAQPVCLERCLGGRAELVAVLA